MCVLHTHNYAATTHQPPGIVFIRIFKQPIEFVLENMILTLKYLELSFAFLSCIPSANVLSSNLLKAVAPRPSLVSCRASTRIAV